MEIRQDWLAEFDSKAAANRAKDRESLDRLRSFREYWLDKQKYGIE